MQKLRERAEKEFSKKHQNACILKQCAVLCFLNQALLELNVFFERKRIILLKTHIFVNINCRNSLKTKKLQEKADVFRCFFRFDIFCFFLFCCVQEGEALNFREFVNFCNNPFHF